MKHGIFFGQGGGSRRGRGGEPAPPPPPHPPPAPKGISAFPDVHFGPERTTGGAGPPGLGRGGGGGGLSLFHGGRGAFRVRLAVMAAGLVNELQSELTPERVHLDVRVLCIFHCQTKVNI